MQTWKQANEWESQWWDDCCDTVGEELKQQVYTEKMGITRNLASRSVLDIGGGPISFLLKCANRGALCAVVDPCKYPDWVAQRYIENNIRYYVQKGENMKFKAGTVFDEAWIYNCLQHTEDPEKIIKKALHYSKIVRIFEWVDNGLADGHIQDLHEKELNKWLGGEGKVEIVNDRGCHGKCYYGVFKGEHYAI